MKIITRWAAKELGLKRYFTGKPCPLGHISERGTGSRQCVVCSLESRKRYCLRNAEKIREKRREKDKRYRLRNAEKVREKNRQWHLRNPEKGRQYYQLRARALRVVRALNIEL